MRHRHLFAVILLVLPFVACAREGGEKLNVTGIDYGFAGVAGTIEGGVIDLTFTNRGEADHEVAFLKTDGDVTLDDVKNGFAPVLEGGPFPAFLTGGSVPGEIPPGETLRSQITLPAGDYVLFCALTDTPGDDENAKPGKSHYDLGMIQEVTVEGDAATAELPSPNGEFTAQDYTFVTPEGVTSGKRRYVFRNGSPKQWHHMILSEYDGNVTTEQALAAFNTSLALKPGQAPPAGTPEAKPFGGTGVMGPRNSMTLELDFQPNKTYVAACFVQDITGGPPHAVGHQMAKAFTVEE